MKNTRWDEVLEVELEEVKDDNSIEEDAHRNIYITGEIDDDILDFIPLIIKWNREDEEQEIELTDRIPIKIHIASNGGLLEPTLILVDVIRLSKTPIYTIISKAYSSGFILSQAGHKRLAYPYAKSLIHSGMVTMEEKLHELPNQLNAIKKQEKQIEEYVLSRTKITQQQYKKNYNKEWILFTDDMIQYGLIDEVIDSLDLLF